MEELVYTMIVEPTEDNEGRYFCAYFPDLPGCTTMGKSMDDLRTHAKEAVTTHIQALKDTGQPVPLPAIITETIAVKAS